jgi:hypothetical protein
MIWACRPILFALKERDRRNMIIFFLLTYLIHHTPTNFPSFRFPFRPLFSPFLSPSNQGFRLRDGRSASIAAACHQTSTAQEASHQSAIPPGVSVSACGDNSFSIWVCFLFLFLFYGTSLFIMFVAAFLQFSFFCAWIEVWYITMGFFF